MKTSTKFIIGLTIAAAAGAAIGMLLAPEKGSKTYKRN
jgi:gas vesicle protein